jgi:hypothetical protein
MNREDLLNIHETLCNKSRSLMRKKNADYAGGRGVEPFANFTRCESMGICKTEAGMLVRMTDKMSRLSSFLESGKFEVADESLEDTTLDIINYAVLLYAFVSDKKNLVKDSTNEINIADTTKGQVQFLQETSKNDKSSNSFNKEASADRINPVPPPLVGCCKTNGTKNSYDTLRETLGSDSSSRNTR